MFLILSGEGAADIGIEDNAIGPMTKIIDNWIECRIGYSLIDTKLYKIIPKQQLADRAKQIKPLSRKGKKQQSETRYFYKNARALALLAHQHRKELGEDTPIILVLFRDADGTASAERGEWQDKWKSMLNGFEAGQISTGVPMIPKPKSEAWVLCALRNKYQNCGKIEDESGNDDSPNSLKQQLEEYLGESGSRMLLNDKIDAGEIDLNQIIDMPSLTAFKNRLDDVLGGL
ncbi:hypothetical protein [Chamaesiphon sp. VAR_48_metabat_403]|uniref:hypothetical protein n=1 Tax=Chamaesiphon sp. VAR_48_metabat_403 TaxID=2964700 RepID=UPI00286DCAA5|nr:hypothetical protein [Chamaesiphon sp. VAR_48_metabat_403]